MVIMKRFFGLLALPLLSLSAVAAEQTILSRPPHYLFDDEVPVHDMPTLADILTITPSASIFYSYARGLELSELLTAEGHQHTLFVPVNKAVMALARKPHQGPESALEAGEITDQEYENLSRANVEKWVSSHIVPLSPVDLSKEITYDTLLPGKSISVTPSKAENGWDHAVLDGEATVVERTEASNGVMYLIDETIKYYEA